MTLPNRTIATTTTASTSDKEIRNTARQIVEIAQQLAAVARDILTMEDQPNPPVELLKQARFTYKKLQWEHMEARNTQLVLLRRDATTTTTTSTHSTSTQMCIHEFVY